MDVQSGWSSLWADLKIHTVDDSEPPLIFIARQRSARGVDLAEYLRIIDHLLQQGQPFLTMHDCRWEPSWTARDRHTVFKWIAEHKQALDELAVAHAILIRTAIGAGMANAVFWGTSLGDRVRALHTPEEGRAWLFERWARR